MAPTLSMIIEKGIEAEKTPLGVVRRSFGMPLVGTPKKHLECFARQPRRGSVHGCTEQTTLLASECRTIGVPTTGLALFQSQQGRFDECEQALIKLSNRLLTRRAKPDFVFRFLS